MTADLRQLSLKREKKKRFYLFIEIVFVKILTTHYARVYRDCVKSIDKMKLHANLGAKLFQKASGLSKWQELINETRKHATVQPKVAIWLGVNDITLEICKGQINVSTITKVSSALLRTANPG